MKKERGISLVALVVTIIVLIILAGVSINMVLGENGIVTMAKLAKENMEIAQKEEEKKLNELYFTMQQEGTTAGVSYDYISKLKEFKEKIAEAITNKGIETKETDSLETMVKNISDIETEADIVGLTQATATENDIKKGETAWVNGNKITGTLEDSVQTAWTLKASYASTCYSSGTDTRTYTASEDGLYVAIYSAGGNGTMQTSYAFSTNGTTINTYSSGSTTAYVSLVSIKFIQMKSGNTITFGFPKQSNSRGTGLVYKIN